MATITTRLSNTGTLLVNGGFDEVTLGSGSISFNGTNQYLTVPASTAFAFGTNDLTIESWCYFSDGTTNSLRVICSNYGPSSTWAADSFYFGKHTFYSGKVTFWINNYDSANAFLVDPTLPPDNIWTHYAVTRSGSTWTLWRNGVNVTTGTYSGNPNATRTNLTIGESDFNANYFYGYLSNFRIVNGTALYNTNFTPPASILPVVANTSLLLNTTDSTNFIKDNGPNKFTVTNNGSSTFNTNGPYNQSNTKIRTSVDTVYNNLLDEVTGLITTNGLVFYVNPNNLSSYTGGTTIKSISGSSTLTGNTINSPTFTASTPTTAGYLTYNGTNQNLDFGNNDLGLSQQDKSCSAWIYFTSTTPGAAGILDKEDDIAGTGYGWGFWVGPITGGNGLWFWPAANKDLKDTTLLNNNTWYHVAWVWNSTAKSCTFFVNGVQKTTQTDATITEGVASSTTLKVATIRGGQNYFAGRIGSIAAYNRQLTAAEVMANYNVDATKYGLPPTNTTPVMRQANTGTISVTNQFDEFTGAPVVDNSLVLWLDAAQTTSYPGSGTTWTDLSGKGNNGTLTSGPTYSSINGGSIGFNGNGSGNYVSVSDSVSLQPANITVCTWAKFNSFNSTNTGVITKPQNSTVGGGWTNPYLSWMIRVEGTGTVLDVSIGSAAVYYPATSAYSFSTNTWYLFTLTYDGTNLKGYVNTSLICSSSPGAVINYTINPVQIGAMNAPSEYLNGYVSDAMIYNRALSSDEVSQNFNALRRRYGI